MFHPDYEWLDENGDADRAARRTASSRRSWRRRACRSTLLELPASQGEPDAVP